MTILYLYPEFTIKGGTERMLIEKANYLVQNGYQVTIVTDSQNGRPFSFELDPLVRHKDIGIDFNIQYRYGLLKRFLLYQSLMRQYKRLLASVIYELHPDVVITTIGRNIDVINHINDGSVKIAEPHTTKKHLRSLHLMEMRGGIFRYVARFLRWNMCRKVAKLDGLVLLTPEDAADWKEVKNVYVIPNYIPHIPEESSKLDDKQVITVGRFNYSKGYDYLISAWAVVQQRHPDWTLHIYGSGELHDDVVGWIEEHQVGGSVYLYEPTDRITDAYLSSSVCALSSRYESFSLVLVEAMSCGVPCVSFDSPYGPRHIINNNEDGLLVKYMDSNALADGICRLIEDDKLRKKLGENAKRNVARFAKDDIMRQWEGLFEQLIHKRA